jgi:hypothetical protein
MSPVYKNSSAASNASTTSECGWLGSNSTPPNSSNGVSLEDSNQKGLIGVAHKGWWKINDRPQTENPMVALSTLEDSTMEAISQGNRAED